MRPQSARPGDTADVGLETTAVATRAELPVPLDGHVSDLARFAGCPAVKAPVQDDAAPDTGGHGEVDEIRAAAARAEAPLGERGGVGIVLEVHRAAQHFSDQARDRDVVPAREIRGMHDTARGSVDRPRRRDPDAGERLGEDVVVTDQAMGVGRNGRDVLDRIARRRHRAPTLRHQASGVVADDQRELRASDVDAEQQERQKLLFRQWVGDQSREHITSCSGFRINGR